MTDDLPAVRGHRPKGVTHKAIDAIAAENRVKVWKCYVGGITNYRDIAELTGVTKTNAHRYVKEELAELAKARRDLSEHWLEVELGRLDGMLELAMKDFTTSIQLDITYQGGRRIIETSMVDRIDVKVAELILKIQDRRSKYLALDAPSQSDRKDDNDFDLAELCNAALQLKEGKMPKEFIEAEFTTEKKDGEEEEGSEEETAGQEEAREEPQVSDGGQGDHEKEIFKGDGKEDIFVLDESFNKDQEEESSPD